MAEMEGKALANPEGKTEAHGEEVTHPKAESQ